MRTKDTSPEIRPPSGESGIWIFAKIVLFIVVPASIFYLIGLIVG